jgi:hypothetical protein
MSHDHVLTKDDVLLTFIHSSLLYKQSGWNTFLNCAGINICRPVLLYRPIQTGFTLKTLRYDLDMYLYVSYDFHINLTLFSCVELTSRFFNVDGECLLRGTKLNSSYKFSRTRRTHPRIDRGFRLRISYSGEPYMSPSWQLLVPNKGWTKPPDALAQKDWKSVDSPGCP